ncbi:MAG: hypothetical protein FWD67_02325 [Betaproteobacteria bacterium]|nr:hypothetical protein [Betaproteobacteria bacterium]
MSTKIHVIPQAVTFDHRAHFGGVAGQLAQKLRAGNVYRREDLARLSMVVDRHLQQLISEGWLKKLAQGLYYAPRSSGLGSLPPDDGEVVRSFLRDTDFLIFSPSASQVRLGFVSTARAKAASRLAACSLPPAMVTACDYWATPV